MTPLRSAALALLLSAVASEPAVAFDALSPEQVRTAYEQMLLARYATRATPIPAGGIEFAIDSARFRLERGELRAMEPVAGGRITGLVFRGTGTLTLELPDSRELDQFRRAAERPDAKRVETPFEALVLRDGGGLVESVLAAFSSSTTPGPFVPDALALERQEVSIERQLVDADAWVARALAGDGRDWALAQIDAGELGWLAVEFDPERAEELQVSKWRPDELATELWISLDRQAERGADGRPASALARQFDLLHAAISIDLTKPSKYPKAGIADIQPRRARFDVELRLRPLRPEARTLSLDLDPWTELASVSDERGRPLLFLRDHVGERSAAIDDQLWDNSTIVLLPEPIGGEERRFRFVYEGEILNFVGGRNWYPGEEEPYGDPHTAELALTALPKHDLRAMGTLAESRDEKGSIFRRYTVDRPVRTVTFSFAEKFQEERIELPGTPRVIAFSSRAGARSKVYDVAADVANAWHFYADRFGPGPETPELYATSIIGGHGQAFDGFLHLGERSWEVQSKGPTELFRSHEVAHEWWGHLVGWKSYRDQWLSEAFADYSAMRFVETTLDEGPELYQEIVETFAAQAMGETKVSRFQRGFRAPLNPKQWKRVGPIALGYRASTADVRDGYYIQCYYRGALVLHMLRGILRDRSGGDALFDSVLAEYANRYRGSEASTADFERVLAAKAPGDWSWFFREWIDETAIPTWRWRWSAGKAADGSVSIRLEIDQSDVPETFRMPVPVRIDGADGSRSVTIEIDQAHETVTIPVSGTPKRVILNPDLAVLARTIEK